MEKIESIVESHPFLQGLKPGQGGDASHFYLVHQGRVALDTFVPGLGARTVQVMAPGDSLGWSWLFPPFRWQFTARAIQSSQPITFDAGRLRENIEADHDLGYELFKRCSGVMFRRLQATRNETARFLSEIGAL